MIFLDNDKLKLLRIFDMLFDVAKYPHFKPLNLINLLILQKKAILLKVLLILSWMIAFITT